MNPDAIKKLQRELNKRGFSLPTNGILDTSTIAAMNSAITKSVASNPRLSSLTQINSPEAIVNAFSTGDWGGVTDLTGKPFSQKEQDKAYRQAERALAPGFKEEATYDLAGVEDALRQEQRGAQEFMDAEAASFGQNKRALDQQAADEGVLFAGSRLQKLRDLKNTFDARQQSKIADVGDAIGKTARNYQYQYGNEAAGKLSHMYQAPSSNVYNPNVASGKVATSQGLSSLYNPAQYNFQGRTTNANKAATQTRAAGLLANRANKLSMSGYKTQF